MKMQIDSDSDSNFFSDLKKPIIFNFDELRYWYSERSSYTLDYKGKSRVIIDSQGGDNGKKCETLILAVNSEGLMYPPVALIKGKKNSNDPDLERTGENWK